MNEGCGSPDERGLVHRNELVCKAPGFCLVPSAVSEMPFQVTVVLCSMVRVQCVPADGESPKAGVESVRGVRLAASFSNQKEDLSLL